MFLTRVGSDPEFRKVFIGHYHNMKGVFRRLGSGPIKSPLFFLERTRRPRKI